MCTILFSYRPGPDKRLVLLANRDEFYDRPTASAANWKDSPEIYAGRDLAAGGTWLGVTESGRIAAVTNYRDPDQESGDLSRGNLVADFLRSDKSTEAYLRKVESEANRYTGFNLIAGRIGDNADELYYFSNRAEGVKQLAYGLYGLSNHLLDTPWPKIRLGKARFSGILERDQDDLEEYFEILADRNLASDSELPDTGIGYEKEKLLSSIFIETPIYGTRSSTVVIIRDSGRIEFEERVAV